MTMHRARCGTAGLAKALRLLHDAGHADLENGSDRADRLARQDTSHRTIAQIQRVGFGHRCRPPPGRQLQSDFCSQANPLPILGKDIPLQDRRHFVGAGLAQQLVGAVRQLVGQHHGPAYKLQAKAHLPGHRSVASMLGRDRAPHCGPARPPRRRLPADHHRRHRTTLCRLHHRRRRRAGAFQKCRRLCRLCRRRARPQAVRQIQPHLRTSRLDGQRTIAQDPLDAGPWHSATQCLAAALLRSTRTTTKPAKLASIAAMRKLLHAVYSVARHHKPFEIRMEQARAA